MAKYNSSTSNKNLMFRLKQVGVEKLFKGLQTLSECAKINGINKIVDSPSIAPMLNGHYFLDEKTLLNMGMHYDSNKIAMYISGNTNKGIIVYLTPKKNKKDLYDTLIEMRIRKEKKLVA